jgi:uncharacterized membrane protein YjjP (DUF1212 family)
MAMDAPARRITAALVFLLVVSAIGSIWRGNSPTTTVGVALAVLVGGGFVLGCYLYARRKD